MAQRKPRIQWQRLKQAWEGPETAFKPSAFNTWRAEVPGGWLVTAWGAVNKSNPLGGTMTFVPDPCHTWKGKP